MTKLAMALLLMALLLGACLPVAEAQPSGPLKLTLVAIADTPSGSSPTR